MTKPSKPVVHLDAPPARPATPGVKMGDTVVYLSVGGPCPAVVTRVDDDTVHLTVLSPDLDDSAVLRLSGVRSGSALGQWSPRA